MGITSRAIRSVNDVTAYTKDERAHGATEPPAGTNKRKTVILTVATNDWRMNDVCADDRKHTRIRYDYTHEYNHQKKAGDFERYILQ